MSLGGFVVGVVAALVLGIVLEARRQRRRHGRPRGAALLRVGMLEVQRLLEPERKVEILLEEPSPVENADSGAPPEAVGTGGLQRSG